MQAKLGTPEERRARILVRREKQRGANVGRAFIMPSARLAAYVNSEREAGAIRTKEFTRQLQRNFVPGELMSRPANAA